MMEYIYCLMCMYTVQHILYGGTIRSLSDFSDARGWHPQGNLRTFPRDDSSTLYALTCKPIGHVHQGLIEHQ